MTLNVTNNPASIINPPVRRGRRRPRSMPSAQDAIRGTTRFSATEAQRINASAEISQQDHPWHYRHTTTTTWKGLRYAVNINIPLSRPFSEYEQDSQLMDELKNTTRDYVELFIRDLKSSLESQSLIQREPGKGFNVVFNDEGYAIYPDGGKVARTFDPSQRNFNASEFKAAEDFVQIATPEAKEISKTINSANLQEMKQGVQSPILNSLRNTPQPSKQNSALQPLTNLRNCGNSCYVDSPFIQLAELAKYEKIKPEYFVQGERNPLYQALATYLYQPHEQPMDLAPLMQALGLPHSQQDMHTSWAYFNQMLNQENIPEDSVLKRLLDPIQLIHPENYPEDKRTLSQLIHLQGTPKVLSVYVPRNKQVIPPEMRQYLIQALTHHQQNIDHYYDELFNALEPANQGLLYSVLENYETLKPLLANKPNMIAQLNRVYGLAFLRERIDLQAPDAYENLNQEVFYDHIRNILLPDENRLIAENTIIQKDTTPIQVDPTIQINGTAYRVESFTSHIGESVNNGHYVSYVKSDDGYEEFDDTTGTINSVPAQNPPLDQAVLYILVRDDVQPLDANAGDTNTGSNKIVSTDALVPNKTTLIVEKGSMNLAGEGMIFVHPTDKYLRDVHPQFNEESEEISSAMAAYKTETLGKKWFKNLFNRNEFELSDGPSKWLSSEPDTAIRAPYLHIVIPNKSNLKAEKAKEALKNVVKTALEKAQKNGNRKVALPLIQFPHLTNENDEVLKIMKEAADEFATKNASTHPGIEEIKIILPKDYKLSETTDSQNQPVDSAQESNETTDTQTASPVTDGLSVNINVNGYEIYHNPSKPDTVDNDLLAAFEQNLTRFNFSRGEEPNAFNLEASNPQNYASAIQAFINRLKILAQTNQPQGIQIVVPTEEIKNQLIEALAALKAELQQNTSSAPTLADPALAEQGQGNFIWNAITYPFKALSSGVDAISNQITS